MAEDTALDNNENRESGESFSAWITQPEMLIALAAVLLSVCGLFISIYEASLMREAQRASVWPHAEVTGTINAEQVTLRVQNTGIGPARIRAAAATYEGKPVADWAALIRRVMDGKIDFIKLNVSFSLINGRVLPVESPPEDILSITTDAGPAAGQVVRQLRRAILDDKTVNVVVCYCSVYDECWTSNLQDVISRRQADAAPTGSQPVNSCADFTGSGI